MRRALNGAILLLVLGLLAAGAGCGDGEETTARDPATAAGPEPSPPAAQDEEDSSSEAAEADRGGEASIEDFGEEAGASDRDAILAAFDGYLTAVADSEMTTACSHLSDSASESLKQFLARGQQDLECPQILPKLLAPSAAAISREQANGEVTRVRVEDGQAFVVFRAPGAKLYVLNFVEEGDEWKATTITASILVPDL